MNDFTDAPSIKPDHATLNVTWTVLIQIRLNCVFFEGCIPPPPRFMACIQIQSSYSGRFIFLHLRTLPRPDFPGSHGAKKHYRLVLFWARALQSFYFLCFLSWRMTYLKRLETELTKYGKTALFFITLFLYWTFPFIYFIFFLLSEFCFRYLFVLTYFDSSRRHTRQGRK